MGLGSSSHGAAGADVATTGFAAAPVGAAAGGNAVGGQRGQTEDAKMARPLTAKRVLKARKTPGRTETRARGGAWQLADTSSS